MPTRTFDKWPKDELQAAAIRGGQRANELGVTHRWTSEQAIEAARRAGLNRHARAEGLPLPYPPSKRAKTTKSKRNVA